MACIDSVYTGSADGKIKVWRASASGDRRKRSLRTTLSKHDSSVNALALTPDGAGLASGGGRVILVWEKRDDGGGDEEMDFFVACCLKGHKGAGLSLISGAATDEHTILTKYSAEDFTIGLFDAGASLSFRDKSSCWIDHMRCLLGSLGVSDVQLLWEGIMAEGVEQLELKFRIFDGTDIGHGSYSSSITVATLKQRLLSEWPQDKSVVPKSVNDMKIIHAGKVLENGKTVAESRAHVGDHPGGVITMHVVVQPAVVKKKTGLKSSNCLVISMQIRIYLGNKNRARVPALFPALSFRGLPVKSIKMAIASRQNVKSLSPAKAMDTISDFLACFPIYSKTRSVRRPDIERHSNSLQFSTMAPASSGFECQVVRSLSVKYSLKVLFRSVEFGPWN
ncbi:hypothetical protein SASPL_120950 [Salvia splendens]|uniref:Ubiquitin-like domain-containing protein n=1 Tax=Salvia splendens TaxID=180675 RepID=A0A8X8XV77_SALSN|nr:hypothetical protein SASPL_120950 [Salvia splendens]